MTTLRTNAATKRDGYTMQSSGNNGTQTRPYTAQGYDAERANLKAMGNSEGDILQDRPENGAILKTTIVSLRYDVDVEDNRTKKNKEGWEMSEYRGH